MRAYEDNGLLVTPGHNLVAMAQTNLELSNSNNLLVRIRLLPEHQYTM